MCERRSWCAAGRIAAEHRPTADSRRPQRRSAAGGREGSREWSETHVGVFAEPVLCGSERSAPVLRSRPASTGCATDTGCQHREARHREARHTRCVTGGVRDTRSGSTHRMRSRNDQREARSKRAQRRGVRGAEPLGVGVWGFDPQKTHHHRAEASPNEVRRAAEATRWWPGAGSNRRPTAFQAVARTN